MISLIIFDFDGVILESVTVKTEAFRALFSFTPEHVEEIVQYHRDNGGMSRYDKFRHIYKIILQEDLSRERFDKLSERFSAIVFDKVIKTPFVPGAQEFLITNYRKIPLYVISATPEEELIQIMEKRELTPYFRKIFGAPRKKTDCIAEIVSLTGVPPGSVVFVGDAKNDYNAACSAGVRFIGRVKPGDENKFKGLAGVDAVIPDMNDLEKHIGRIV